MEDDKVLREVAKRSAEKRLSCRVAFEVAKELGVEPIVVGRAANKLGIKLINCQLGCFGDKSKPKT